MSTDPIVDVPDDIWDAYGDSPQAPTTPAPAPDPAPAAPAAPATPAASAASAAPKPTAPAKPAQPAADAAAAPAASAEPTAEDAETEPSKAPTSSGARPAEFYAKRRRHYATVAVLLAAALIWFVGGKFNPVATSTAAGEVKTAADAARPGTPAPITADLAIATKALAADGDLTGLTLPGARVAASGTTMFASREVAGTCWGYGIVEGVVTEATADVKHTVCNDAAIAATQQRLDAAAGEDATSSRTEAVAKLQSAAALVGFYGTHNLTGGVPDLTGLTLPDNTVVVSNNTGSTVRLTATVDGLCQTTVVDAGGNAELPRDCS